MNMSREELVRALQHSRHEVLQLRQEITQVRGGGGGGGGGSQPGSRPSSASSNGSHGQMQRFFPNQRYAVSMNVLVISGGQEHRARTLPLQAVLERNGTTSVRGERDADTPINNMMAANAPNQGISGAPRNPNDPFARHSIDLSGRFSNVGGSGQGGYLDSRNSSTNSFDFGGHGGSATRLSALSPTEQQQMQMQQQQQQQQGRPGNMNANALTASRPGFALDADALVTGHTLAAFARSHIQAPLSPQSMTATNMIKYLSETFAYNGFVHEPSPKQMEAVGRSLLNICQDVEQILAQSPPHPEIQSPVYTFGDIHGNFADLHYFCSNIISFGDMRFVPLNLLFLGDYVDRGPHSVEVIAYLFSLKVLAPSKVTLLRGNHEDSAVNHDVSLYGATSFRYQCRQLFGELLGEEVWLRCSRVFAFLPLTASIDKKIFCTHGGLPRYTGGPDNRMEMLRSRDPPRLESFFVVPENETRVQQVYRQLACDVCWSDPADDDRLQLDEHGFGNNPRGAGVILFGGTAVDRFCQTFGFEYIFRAHQEKSDGLKISKNARVVTVFSTSGYVGHQNGAGCVYVGTDGKIRLIIKEHEGTDGGNDPDGAGGGGGGGRNQALGRPSKLADN